MKTDAELNSENAGENGEKSQVCESSVARPVGSEAATSAAAGAAASGESPLATGARVEKGQAKAVIPQLVGPSVEAEKITLDRDNRVGAPSVAIASFDAAVNPLEGALAALDRRDYGTAKRLFEALGRKDATEAIAKALAALDRKDYATAQGLFEALEPLKPTASAGGQTASDFRDKAQYKPVVAPLEVVPFADAQDRRPAPQAGKAKRPGLRTLFLALVLFSILGASAIYASRPDWTFAAARSEAIAGLHSAVDLVKARLQAITGPSGREEERSAMRDLSAALTQATIRLDQIEHEHGARLDKLDERIDQISSSRLADDAAAPAAPASQSADVAARLDKLEKSVAIPAAPASQSADIVAKLDKLEKRIAAAGAPASQLADVVTRLDKLEKRIAAAAISPAKSLLPATPKQSTLMARAAPSASDGIAKPDDPRTLLRDYSVEDVRDGVAVVDSRYGPQQVAPGDFIPGAGRVLRIERRGGAWFVETSRGVIASGTAPISGHRFDGSD